LSNLMEQSRAVCKAVHGFIPQMAQIYADNQDERTSRFIIFIPSAKSADK